MYEPLRIKAYLQCGVVGDWTLPLDGVLLYQACRERWGAQDATIPGSGLYQNEHGNLLPLKRVHGVQWYYHASFAQWSQPVAEGQDHWNKRFDQGLADLVDFEGKRGKVLIEQGRYKAYHMPVFYRHSLYVTWYVVGEREGVQRLLNVTTNLGKKADQGWGRVLRWEIEPCAEDWSIWRDGKPMRAIPSPEGMILTGYRPPYWDRKNQALCIIPNNDQRG